MSVSNFIRLDYNQKVTLGQPFSNHALPQNPLLYLKGYANIAVSLNYPFLRFKDCSLIDNFQITRSDRGEIMPKSFNYSLKSKQSIVPSRVIFQEQCSSGGGGNGRCGASRPPNPPPHKPEVQSK